MEPSCFLVVPARPRPQGPSRAPLPCSSGASVPSLTGPGIQRLKQGPGLSHYVQPRSVVPPKLNLTELPVSRAFSAQAHCASLENLHHLGRHQCSEWTLAGEPLTEESSLRWVSSFSPGSYLAPLGCFSVTCTPAQVLCSAGTLLAQG